MQIYVYKFVYLPASGEIALFSNMHKTLTEIEHVSFPTCMPRETRDEPEP